MHSSSSLSNWSIPSHTYLLFTFSLTSTSLWPLRMISIHLESCVNNFEKSVFQDNIVVLLSLELGLQFSYFTWKLLDTIFHHCLFFVHGLRLNFEKVAWLHNTLDITQLFTSFLCFLYSLTTDITEFHFWVLQGPHSSPNYHHQKSQFYLISHY